MSAAARSNFIPKSFVVWFCVQWMFWVVVAGVATIFERRRERLFGPSLSPKVLAQYVLGIAHVWMTLGFGAAYAYREWLGFDAAFIDTWADMGIGLSVTYFVVDAMLIAVIDFENQSMFLIHHAIAIYIGVCASAGFIGITETSRFMFAIEMSNVCYTAWDLLKRHHRANPAVLRPWYDSIAPAFAFTYVPCRTVILSIATFLLLCSTDLDAVPEGNHRYSKPIVVASLWASIMAVSGMSWFFSMTVASIGYRVMRDKFPGLLSFEAFTYVLKAYVSLAWFMLILPNAPNAPNAPVHPWSIPMGVGFLLVDACHIAARLAGCARPKSHACTVMDFTATCIKIVANGLYLYARVYLDGHITDNNKIWTYTNALNVGFLIQNVYDVFAFAEVGVTLARGRDRESTSGIVARRGTHTDIVYEWDTIQIFKHCIMSALVVTSVPSDKVPYSAIGAYFLGGLVWISIPAKWRGRAGGWMNLCVILGDAALLSWGTF